MTHDTVGSLLAVIANTLNDGLRMFMLADKGAWEGPDEYEQMHQLEATLDEAKRDFQDLPKLINGNIYYENDRRPETLDELRILCTRFELHIRNLKDWLRTGGPANPKWTRQGLTLQRDLHRAQCRATRRIFNSNEQDGSARCLGAWQVYRVQRSTENAQQRQWEELAACKQVGHFERFGEEHQDIAFVCDFCDGHIVWNDLREMPSARRSVDDAVIESASAIGSAPEDVAGQLWTWASVGFQRSDGAEKNIVFAPVAIANHMPPEPGAFQSAILCPFCDNYVAYEQGDTEMDQVRWNQDEAGFEDLASFAEHLAWQHAPLTGSRSSCAVM